jgi:hypothetical protein
VNLDLPAFLDRSKWTPQQHAANETAWDRRLAEQRERNEKHARRIAREREIETIKRQLAQPSSQAAEIEFGSVRARVVEGLKRKLQRLEAEANA